MVEFSPKWHKDIYHYAGHKTEKRAEELGGKIGKLPADPETLIHGLGERDAIRMLNTSIEGMHMKLDLAGIDRPQTPLRNAGLEPLKKIYQELYALTHKMRDDRHSSHRPHTAMPGDRGHSRRHATSSPERKPNPKRVPEKLLPSAKPLLKAFFSMLP